MLAIIAMKDGTFKFLDGSAVSNDCVAVKVGPGDWRIVDFQTGALVKGNLKSLTQCKDFMASFPAEYRERLDAFRKSDKYKRIHDRAKQEWLKDFYGR